ncbi:MAG: Com family DNA-binding transcriptional regulator [Candidatus Paceibacterota bacterium]|jgi:phage FluMu protein Com|nr:Com family DNA-binding transcriptional regulator [bacterium]
MENISSKNEYRCSHCNKLFFKGVIEKGEIEIKCRGCKNVDTVKINKSDTEDPPEEDLEKI